MTCLFTITRDASAKVEMKSEDGVIDERLNDDDDVLDLDHREVWEIKALEEKKHNELSALVGDDSSENLQEVWELKASREKALEDHGSSPTKWTFWGLFKSST